MAVLTAGVNRPGAARDLGPSGPPAARTTGPAGGNRSTAVPSGTKTVRSWPLLVLAAPAAGEVWSGWVGIAQKTGFGLVSPLPGIWPSLHLDTSITLPVGVEAYAAYALRAWLSGEHSISDRTRRFAKWSAICSFALGMAGQVAYHLLAHGPRGSLTQIPQLAELRSYLTHNTPQLPDRVNTSAARPGPVAASPHPAHRNDRSRTCWPFTLARGLRAIRCEDVGTGSPCRAVAAGFGDARRLQALQGPIGGSAAQPRASHDALGGDVGGAAALVIAHLVVADAVVAAQRHGGESDQAVPVGKNGQVRGLAAHSRQRSAR